MPRARARDPNASTHCAKGKRADCAAALPPEAPATKAPQADMSIARRDKTVVIAARLQGTIAKLWCAGLLGRIQQPLALIRKERAWINEPAVLKDFEMEVRLRRKACISDASDNFVFADALTGLDLIAGQMRIGSLQTIPMIDSHIIP